MSDLADIGKWIAACAISFLLGALAEAICSRIRGD